MIDHARLLELLSYCPETGNFIRKISLSPKTKVGDIAGGLTKGYITLSVDGVIYSGHNLAWFYTYNVWPVCELDHKDRNRANNAILNLREATHSQNGSNAPIRKTNICGFKGVTKCGSKFKSAIMVERKRYHIGVFNTAKEAAHAYDLNAIERFGEFALTNKKLNLI